MFEKLNNAINTNIKNNLNNRNNKNNQNNKNSKKKKYLIDTSGNKYEVIKKLGKGRQALVIKVKDVKNNNFYAIKLYEKDPYDVKSNIEHLISIGDFTDKNKNKIESIVLPISLIVPPKNYEFGYLMDYVDLNGYMTLPVLWENAKAYPKVEILCKIIKNISISFDCIHSNGFVYKDVNENNIFLNNTTGDIKIIDNDNIAPTNKFTIQGTGKYRAPEVILGSKPDISSDKFSLAVFIYRLLIGRYPFDGKYTRKYCIDNDVLEMDCQKQIYGINPIFTFHPANPKNGIDQNSSNKEQMQKELYNHLPTEIKKLFVSTFVTNISESRKTERASAKFWHDKFDEIENNLVKCPKCKKPTFSDCDLCYNCLEELPKAKLNENKINNNNHNNKSNQNKTIEKIINNIKNKKNIANNTNNTNTNLNANTQVNINNQANTNKKTNLTNKKLSIKILSKGSNNKSILLNIGNRLNSKQISDLIKDDEDVLEYIYVNGKYAIRNLSKKPWHVLLDNKLIQVSSNKICPIRKDMKIVIIPKQVQINFIDLI